MICDRCETPYPSREDLEQNAGNAKRDVDEQIRFNFQMKYPHYTPPNGKATAAWRLANIKLHGLEECIERWPEIFG